jgi:hypothetical protein
MLLIVSFNKLFSLLQTFQQNYPFLEALQFEKEIIFYYNM